MVVRTQPTNGVMWGEFRVLVRTPRKQDRSLVSSVSSKHGVVLEGVCVVLAGVVGRSEFASGFSLLLGAVIQLDLREKTCFCHVYLPL